MIRPIISITKFNINKEPAVVTKFIIKDTIYAIKVTTRTLKKGTLTPIILAAK
jgi:hypothetical protein